MYKLNPDDFNAADFYGKTLAVYVGNSRTVGTLDGYDYDYDEDGEQVVEIDITQEGGSGAYGICFSSDENVKIDILD